MPFMATVAGMLGGVGLATAGKTMAIGGMSGLGMGMGYGIGVTTGYHTAQRFFKPTQLSGGKVRYKRRFTGYNGSRQNNYYKPYRYKYYRY